MDEPWRLRDCISRRIGGVEPSVFPQKPNGNVHDMPDTETTGSVGHAVVFSPPPSVPIFSMFVKVPSHSLVQ